MCSPTNKIFVHVIFVRCNININYLNSVCVVYDIILSEIMQVCTHFLTVTYTAICIDQSKCTSKITILFLILSFSIFHENVLILNLLNHELKIQ